MATTTTVQHSGDPAALLRALLPRPHRDQVASACERIRRATAHDEPLTAFLRPYLGHSLQRVASNVCRLEVAARLGARILDVGSLGIEAALVRHAHPDAVVCALSYEGDHLFYDGDRLSRVPLATAGAIELRIGACDVESDPLPFADASFDLLTCFEMLEHLKATPLRLLDEVRRVLQRDGILLLTTPNVVGTRATARALLGRHPQENPRYHRDARYGVVHPKEYAPYELQALCAARGLRPARLTTEYYRGVGWPERAFGAALRALRAVAGRRFQPTGLGDNCVALATRSEPSAALLEAVFEA